jgi:2'-5' RNA ligase
LAIELPDEVKTALARLIRDVTRSRVSGLKPVRPDNVHINLKFLGDLEIEQVEAITRVVTQAAASIRPFTVKLGGVGAYPNNKNARVLWAGLDGDVVPLRQAQRRLDRAMEGVGVKRDSREFSPHVTIARIRDRTQSTDRRRATEALFSAEFTPGLAFPVANVSLIRSVLLPEGPDYMRLAHIPLLGASAAKGRSPNGLPSSLD